MNSINDIWASIMEVLSQKLTPISINTWFTDCTPVDFRDDTLVIHTPTDYKREILQRRFADVIKEALRELFSCDLELEILAGDELEEYENRSDELRTLPWMEGYTFENFIVGKSNEYAYAAARGVVKSPGNRT